MMELGARLATKNMLETIVLRMSVSSSENIWNALSLYCTKGSRWA